MNTIGRDIIKAINEGKWLDITYKNKQNEKTRYWIAINDINVSKQMLKVDGFNLRKGKEPIQLFIYYDSIISSKIVEGTYYERNKDLIQEIKTNPDKFTFLYINRFNFRVLEYLAECHKLDNHPYKSEYTLISKIDDDELTDDENYQLSEIQFQEIVEKFQKRVDRDYRFIELCLSCLSINTKRGLYVLAYRKLNLDIKNKRLVPDEEISLNREYKIEGYTYSINKFLGEDDLGLLSDFEKNQKEIRQKIHGYNEGYYAVDDKPYILHLEREYFFDLNHEYQGIFKMYEEGNVTAPIRGFFGEIKSPSLRKKNWPIALLSKKVDLDQLLSIHNGMKYPLTYVQGPPGTGKTWTIVNTLITAFFNEKTVLVASSNNHPLDGIYKQLRNIYYNNRKLMFPAIRLGNRDLVTKAINEIKMIDQVKKLKIFEETLDRSKKQKKERIQKLSEILELHEEVKDLKERRTIIQKIIEENSDSMFRINLQTNQLELINKRLRDIGEIKDEDAIRLLDEDEGEFFKYLYFTGAKYIKRLFEPKYEDLLNILNMSDVEKRITEFNRYLSNEENLKKFMRVFPIIITTNISSNRLGEPKPIFDLTIIDEAGQCNPATSLVSIIRGQNLMLLGDLQQLGPVNVLDEVTNNKLKEKYQVGEEYDYLTNSIYSIYNKMDAINNQILLSYHYRCNEKIIKFNNKKFYHNLLKVRSNNKEEKPLVFVDIENPSPSGKNRSLSEAEAIVSFVEDNPGRKIGVITPFVKQRELIEQLLKDNNLSADVGTIHAFQGDEKEVILLSSAITPETYIGTYEWIKSNRELINVATSRAREKLVLYACEEMLLKLSDRQKDDFYDLYQYIKTNGESEVRLNIYPTRALGFKPYNTETEAAFMETLSHALSICDANSFVRKEVPLKNVLPDDKILNSLYFTGQFDFVIYRKYPKEQALFAFELDGPEHKFDEQVIARDKMKEELARAHGLEIIRVENSYARRYNHVKQILIEHFKK
jgi:superfamily I DNA and/or RNA helicase